MNRPRHISAMRQTRGAAIEQQAMNRLQHCTWAKPNRYAACGINPRRELARTALVIALWAVFLGGLWVMS